MKKLIILSVIALVLIISTVIAVGFLNQKTIQFDFDNNDYSVEVIDESDNVIKTLTKSDNIKLKDGQYSYQLIGEGIEAAPTEFTVNSSFTISVVSKLTPERLSELLSKESGSIRDILLNTYSTKSDFELVDITLYERGEWASASLLVNIPQQAPNTYRTVLHKENGNWKVKIPPTIAINKNNYKDVPESVFDSLYKF